MHGGDDEPFEPMTLEEALAMQGFGWDGDLDAMRDADAPEGPQDLAVTS